MIIKKRNCKVKFTQIAPLLVAQQPLVDEVQGALLQAEAFPLLPHPEVIALIVDDGHATIYANSIIKQFTET